MAHKTILLIKTYYNLPLNARTIHGGLDFTFGLQSDLFPGFNHTLHGGDRDTSLLTLSVGLIKFLHLFFKVTTQPGDRSAKKERVKEIHSFLELFDKRFRGF